jgi:hypothetical protein
LAITILRLDARITSGGAILLSDIKPVNYNVTNNIIIGSYRGITIDPVL